MTQIEKYELKRTSWLLLCCLCIVIVAVVCVAVIKSDVLAIALGFLFSIFGCVGVNLVFKYYDNKIEKFKKEHGEELSLDSSNL